MFTFWGGVAVGVAGWALVSLAALAFIEFFNRRVMA